MSLRYFTFRLSNNVCGLLKHLRKGRRLNAIDTVLPEKGVPRRGLQPAVRQQPVSLRSVGSAFGSHARRILVDNRISKVSSDWKKRFTTRLFYGDTARTFAFVGLSLAGGGLITKEDEQENLCLEIRELVSRFPWKSDLINHNNELYEEKISLKDLDIGSFLAKGCSAAIYTAKLKEEDAAKPNIVENEESFDNNYPFVLKMMFNYDIQSNSMAILRAMYKETIPAQVCQIDQQISYWSNLFQNQRITLPSHPNIVTVYNAFADYMPNINGSMEMYPDALPTVYNPNGVGRNMTLFLLMKRYQYSLCEYLHIKQQDKHDSIMLFTQLLEAIVHLSRHGIAHRDLKSDNILVEEISTNDDELSPLLVITDFGCCLADKENGLRVPYKSDNVDKGGNINLMAPEIITQQPGVFSVLDYSKSDLWAAATIAYEMFGLKNPFCAEVNGVKLSNYDYEDGQLPDMGPEVPVLLKNLVKNLLSRNPKMRLNPEIAANVCQLYLWAPSSWMSSKKMPNAKEILEWLMCLTFKIICEGRMFNQLSEVRQYRNAKPEYVLIGSFLSRIRLFQVKNALKWIQSNMN